MMFRVLWGASEMCLKADFPPCFLFAVCVMMLSSPGHLNHRSVTLRPETPAVAPLALLSRYLGLL